MREIDTCEIIYDQIFVENDLITKNKKLLKNFAWISLKELD